MSTEQVNVNDPRYNILQRQIRMDEDTAKIQTRIISASSAPVISTDNGYISETLEFNVQCQQVDSRMNFSESFVRYGVIIGTDANPSLAPTDVALPWNISALMAQSYKTMINSSSIDICGKSTYDLTKADLTCKLINDPSYLQMKVGGHHMMSDPHECYCVPLAANMTTEKRVPVITAAGDTTFTLLTRAVADDAVTAPAGVVYNDASKELLESVKSKARRRCKGGYQYIYVPLSLYTELHGMSNNIVNFRLQLLPITPTQSSKVLEKFTESSAGYIFVHDVKIIASDYMLTEQKRLALRNEKDSGKTEALIFYNNDVFPKTLNGQELTFNNQKNLDSVMIMSYLADTAAANTYTCSNSYCDLGIPGYAQTFTADKAADGYGVSEHGQLLYASQRRTDEIGVINDIQLQVGSIFYPSIPMRLKPSGGDSLKLVLEEAYDEYLKSKGMLGSANSVPAISYEEFVRTKTFIQLKPWSNNATHASQSNDVMIRCSVPSGASYSCLVILRKLKGFKIDAKNGVESLNYSN